MSDMRWISDMSQIGQSSLVVFLVFILVCVTNDEAAGSGTGVPCTYEGHLRTDKNWFGYLANISIISTGRMTFQFTYQTERCCQNILFYSESQMAIINARMNCWQKEYLLRPEDDQILRLTPRFSWSGCHVIHPDGVATYVCEGGRSFTVDQPASGPTTWYIAVSNCATLQGLDLQYRLVIYGHIGECRSGSGYPTSGSSSSGSVVANPRSVLMPRSPNPITNGDVSCIFERKLNVSSNWYGFLANVSFVRGGGMRFLFTYPVSRNVQNILLYTEDDVGKLRQEQTCWQKHGVISPINTQEQILDLSPQSSWNGCVTKAESSGAEAQLTCQGERWYDEPRKMYMAVSNCQSRNGLLLNYHLEVFGFTNDICSQGVGLVRRPPTPLQLLLLLIVSILSLFLTHSTAGC